MSVRNLDKILRPRSVAIVGASNRPDHVSSTVLKNLLEAGYEGDIFPVHPDFEHVQGLKAYPTVSDLPRLTDLAVVCSPAKTVPSIVRQAGEFGLKGMVIISAGFREIGGAGQKLEQRIGRQAAHFPGLRILGPNCMGIVVPHLKLNASLASATPKPGRVAFVSQSGTLCSSALDWALQEDIGFSHFVSIGNMLGVSVADLIDYFAADSSTDSIILYVESITQARHFMSAARAVTKEKPIVVYKAGRFTQSADAVVSHTGAMSGIDAVYEAAFERAGVVRVFEIDDMFDCAQLLARVKPPTGPRLAIVTNAGGPGVVATDSLLDRKGELAKLSSRTIEQLNEFLPRHWSRANPIDILGTARPEQLARTVEIVLNDSEVDAVLVVLTPQANTDPTASADLVAQIAGKSGKPILTAWMGGKSMREGTERLKQAGVPTYTTPKNAVHAFMHLVSYARNRETLYETPRDVPVSYPMDRQTHEMLFESIHGRDIVFEQSCKRLLEAYGIRTTEPLLAGSRGEAVRLARRIGYPVVLKIVSPQITHKNEVGGVSLNVGDDEAVRSVYDRIIETVERMRPDANIEGISVQPMVVASDGFEMILGSRKDPVFGAVILVGAGGVAAEALGDFALGLPPLSERLARRMLESLRTWPILSGKLRRPAVDVERLIETIIRFSFLVADCPQIAEMDVNPLMVTPNDVVALDARIRVDLSHPHDARPFSHLAIRPYPEHLVREARLKNGRPVVLRPIKPEDEPLWLQMLVECSVQSIRYRFRSMFRQMTHEMATRFCFMDYDRELAIVAEVVGESDRKLVGAGHLICDADHTNAEYAVLVPDEWQQHGVGSLITECCAEVAANWGLREIYGETDRLNRGMIATFKHAGFDLDFDTDPDVVLATKNLASTASVPPSS